MEEISKLSNLSFFKIAKYSYEDLYVCDFRDIPRPHYCMGFITDGEGRFDFGDESVTVKKGDIIFVPEGSTYVSTWSGEPYVNYISMHFSFEFSDILAQNKNIKIQRISIDNENIGEIFEEAFLEYNKQNLDEFYVLSLFYAVMSKVYPRINYSRTREFDERIKKAAEYIEHHYDENFSVSYLAELCNMSVSYFHAAFKKQVGDSVIKYKHKICIHHAQLMLIENKKTIEEISDVLGFKSSVYFREIFKKVTGKSPREYRKIEKI